MPGVTTTQRFGPFELDAARRRLTRDREPVPLSERQMTVLLLLVSSAGQAVPKGAIADAAWRGVAVTDNSIVQLIRGLRQALGVQPDGRPYIETLPRDGYRFVAPVEAGDVGDAELSYAAVDPRLEPQRAFLAGLGALETLDRDAVDRAHAAFAEALRLDPEFPAGHIGIANALLLGFESTRTDAVPDVTRLQQAHHHAREGCRLIPSSGDAWATIALVAHRIGDADDAIAAARYAVRLGPHDWRHHLRLAFVSWGQQRLGAALDALALNPGLALAHWFAATVYVARGAFDFALEELRAGCAAQDAQGSKGSVAESGIAESGMASGAAAGASGSHLTARFAAVGLHLLHGLVLAATGRVEEGLAEIEREATAGEQRHVYGRESSGNRCYARGALLLRQGRGDEAQAAFHEALTRVPGHPLASVALNGGSSQPVAVAGDRPLSVDAAIARAAAFALDGKHEDAARVCWEALVRADPGQAGWLLPVEPLLHVTAHREAWVQPLATLSARAS